MHADPKISIIIPVYNGARYVGRAIESALRQSYGNIEILVVDDGSTDDGGTERAVAPYFDRVRYIRHENRGVAGALNTGVREMSGDIFSWLSHDDVFVPEKTRRQVDFMRGLSISDAVVFSDYAIVDENDRVLYDVMLDRDMLQREPLLAVLRGCLNGCTMLMSRTVFDKVGLFDERLWYTQDYDLWDRIEDHFPLVHCPGVMVRQRVHHEQGSRKPAAIEECNALWLRLVDRRHHAKRTRISGSPLRFLHGMREFLSHTPYEGALAGLDSQIANCVAGTKISIVFDAAAQADADAALAAIRDQSLRHIQIIAVNSVAVRDGVTHVASNVSSGAMRQAAVAAATGDYIAFASAPARLNTRSLEAQLERMQMSGALASVSTDLLMINRVLLDMPVDFALDDAQFLAALDHACGLEHVAVREPRSGARERDLFVSIVLPTYNRAHTLARAIRSVMAQSWRAWELIVVDDGSTDGTTGICDAFEREIGDRFRHIKTCNGGASAARNIGVSASDAAYIAFLDSDDVFFPEKLAVQMSVLARSSAKFAFSNWATYEERGNVLAAQQMMPAPFTGRIYPSLLAISRNKIVTPAVVARREAILEVGSFDTTMAMCEDIDLWRRICRFNEAVRIDTPLLGIYVRKESVFPYASYVHGRLRLYEKAAAEDPALTMDLFRFLMAELFADYASIAAYRGDWHQKQLIRSARRAMQPADGVARMFEIGYDLAHRLEILREPALGTA